MTAPSSLDEDMEQGLTEVTTVDGFAGPSVRRARAWLSRAAEPGSVAFRRFVKEADPVEAVGRLRAGRATDVVQALVGARVDQDATLVDLARVVGCGGRLVVPGDDEGPTLLLHGLTPGCERRARRPVLPLAAEDRPRPCRWRCGCAGRRGMRWMCRR